MLVPPNEPPLSGARAKTTVEVGCHCDADFDGRGGVAVARATAGRQHVKHTRRGTRSAPARWLGRCSLNGLVADRQTELRTDIRRDSRIDPAQTVNLSLEREIELVRSLINDGTQRKCLILSRRAALCVCLDDLCVSARGGKSL